MGKGIIILMNKWKKRKCLIHIIVLYIPDCFINL